jgi:hypothetical protein
MSVMEMVALNFSAQYDLNPASQARHVPVCKIEEANTMARSRLVRSALVTFLTAAFVAAPFKVVLATAPQDSGVRQENQNLSPEQRFERRYPQPVKVGALIGLPVLDERDSTYGYIRDVVRTAEGKVLLVVPYRDWLGWAPTDWGRKTVAVPIETVAILAKQVAALDFSRADFAAAPAYNAQDARVPADETIRIAVYRR